MTTVPGPMLLSAFLARNWRRGVVIGLLAVLTGVMGFLLAWLAGGSVTSWVGSIHVFGSQRLLLQNIADAVSFQLPPILGAAGAIMTILLVGTQKFPRRGLGLGGGLSIGLGLSVASSLVFGSVLGDDSLIYIPLYTPPLIWVSAVYFPELVGGRSGWQGFLVWALLVLAAFGLPFVVLPLLGRVFPA